MSLQDEMLTVEEAATYLKVDAVTIQRELKRGRLPGNKVGRAWRLSRIALQDYVRGGDPTAAMLEAWSLFDWGELDAGLRVLLRNCVGDDRMPPAYRRDLLQRLAILADAEEKGSVARAQEAMYPEGEPPLIEERSSTTGLTRMTVNVMRFWNDTVKHFVGALKDRRKSRK